MMMMMMIMVMVMMVIRALTRCQAFHPGTLSGRCHFIPILQKKKWKARELND